MSHKYLKKYMGKSGKWIYVYNDGSTSGGDGANKLSSVANNAQGALNKARAVIRSSSNSAKAKTGSSNIYTAVKNTEAKLGIKYREFNTAINNNKNVKAFKTGSTEKERQTKQLKDMTSARSRLADNYQYHKNMATLSAYKSEKHKHVSEANRMAQRVNDLDSKRKTLKTSIDNTSTTKTERMAATVGAKVNSVKKKKAKKQFERTHYVKQPDGSYVKKGRFGSKTVLRVGKARVGI